MTTVLVGTAGGLHEVGRDDPIAMAGGSVDSLSPEGRWAVVDGHSIYRKEHEWSEVARGSVPFITCIHPFDDGALMGTEEARLLRLHGGQLEQDESFDKAPGRDDWFTPWGGPPAVRSIAAIDGAAYVNVHVGGIVRSSDEGEWVPTIDISADVHEVRAMGDVLVAACAVGLAESGDGGYAWSFDDEGLHATYARAVAVGSDYLFMSVSQGPRGGDAAIYRQPCDGDRAFERCDLPSFRENIDTGCLDAGDDLAVFGAGGNVYMSEDAGATWNQVQSGLPPINCVRILS